MYISLDMFSSEDEAHPQKDSYDTADDDIDMTDRLLKRFLGIRQGCPHCAFTNVASKSDDAEGYNEDTPMRNGDPPLKECKMSCGSDLLGV